MRQPVVLVLVLLHALLCAAALASSEFHQLHAKTLENEDFDFSNLQGRVVVITNVASECGYTDDNYEKLTALEDEYDGELAVLAFPCNQFGKQEPGSARKIREFAEAREATFTLMEKTDVNGGRTHPVYQFLKKATKSEARDIAWNFETKFLVSRDGAVIKRFSDAFDPDSLRGEIDQMLARPDL